MRRRFQCSGKQPSKLNQPTLTLFPEQLKPAMLLKNHFSQVWIKLKFNMKKTKIIMGMPIIVEILGTNSSSLFKKVFGYFESVDDKFSTYKPSEINLINNHQLSLRNASQEMQEIWALSEKTKKETNGF